MAARVTKLFLQNCVEARAPPSGAKGKSAASDKTGKLAGAKASVKVQSATKKNARRRGKKGDKFKVRFLEAAQQEQKTSDKTAENLRKLKTRANDKSKRLMAKALAKRQAMRL